MKQFFWNSCLFILFELQWIELYKIQEIIRRHSPSMITALSSSSPCWTSSNDDSKAVDLLLGLASIVPEIVITVCMTNNNSVVSDDARCRRFIPRETETSEKRTRQRGRVRVIGRDPETDTKLLSCWIAGARAYNGLVLPSRWIGAVLCPR